MMIPYWIAATLILATVAHLPEAAADELPTADYLPEAVAAELPAADYQKTPGDPGWLAFAAQFHGHLGPWATAGVRIGMAGRRAVAAHGYFDVDVTVAGPFDRPPKSCFLDGLQVSTGATWGKRNIHWKKDEEIVVQIKNIRSGKVIEIRPTPALMDLLRSVPVNPETQHRDDHALEKTAREIATLPEAKLMRWTTPDR